MNWLSQISSKLTKVFVVLAIVFLIGAVAAYFITDIPHFMVLCLMGAFWCWFGYYWNSKFVEDKDGKV